MLDLFSKISTFVFDIDGVLTDGSLLLAEEGHILRTMNIKDGYALQLAVKQGYKVWALSGGRCEAARLRLNKLGVEEVHIGVEDKKSFLQEMAMALNVRLEEIIYMGDDIPDYGVMKICGLPCCPSDAVPEIKQISKYISPLGGGKGCVRDVLEKVLKLNGHWVIPE
jgi:3-deoxy-D-manno-octulosonate 8-phosphate phosphatase (KDO 8-P phosphatase)